MTYAFTVPSNNVVPTSVPDSSEVIDTEQKTDYCRGWDKGYVEGYCHENPNCIKPIPPICPIPKIDCSEGYRCGYNRGFLKGLANR